MSNKFEIKTVVTPPECNSRNCQFSQFVENNGIQSGSIISNKALMGLIHGGNNFVCQFPARDESGNTGINYSIECCNPDEPECLGKIIIEQLSNPSSD